MKIPQRVRQIELPQFDLLNDLAAEWRARGADVIALGQALPGFDPPPLAIAAMKAALDTPAAHIYSADAGLPVLRDALASSLQPLGARVDPAREIIITAGANQAFQLALTTLIDPGDEVVLVSPYFLNHEMAVRSVGGRVREAATSGDTGFIASCDGVCTQLTAATRAVVVVTPSNPTGAVMPPGELHRLIAACAARDIIVIVDETYLRFSYDTPPATALSCRDWQSNVVVVGSFSKAFAITGWRCGYLVAGADAIAEAMKVQDSMLICAPVPVQQAVAAVLAAEPDYQLRWLPVLRARRAALYEALARIPGVTPVWPQGGFFVMTKIARLTDSRQGALALIDAEQVVTIPGAFFGTAGEGYLRFSYGAATETRLQEACARLARFLSGPPAA